MKGLALYQEQRFRIDTIRQMVDHNYRLLLGSQANENIAAQYQSLIGIIERAKDFANTRLLEQRNAFDRYQENVTLWVNSILIFILFLLVMAIVLTTQETIARKQLKNLHESILTNATIGVTVLEFAKDETGAPKPRVSFSNYGSVARESDKDNETIVNLSSFSLVDREMLEASKVALTTGKPTTREIMHKVAGKTFWFITNLSKVSETAVAFYYQDITRIKQYSSELQLKVAELESVNKDLEQFAHATSHDLQEPFRKIQIMTDMIQSNPDSPGYGKYLDAIVRASKKGTKLIDQILKYSKIQFDRSELERVDLNEVLQQSLEDFDLTIIEKDATVEVQKLPVINANRTQMVQLFSNLIGNALKFSDPERKPQIKVWSRTAHGNGVPELRPEQSYHLISVNDNGIGFDEEYKQRIFNAFERLNNYNDFPGFGLGLSLCKKIVLNHKGTIRASSVRGQGSEFIIYLPDTGTN